MKSEGQAWALEQLADIVQASSGSLEIIALVEPTAEGEAASVSLSVDCSGYPRKQGGIPLKARERLLLKIPVNFPLELPRLNFAHTRYRDFSHVQWGSYICLYQATDSEWQPEDGLFGFMQRVDDWFRAAAASELDPAGMPLHPPVTYAVSSVKVVPTQNTPVPEAPFWAGYAKITRENDNRIELGQWIDQSGPIPDGRLAAVVLLPTGMPHEYPDTVSGLLKELKARDVPVEIIRLMIQLGVLRSDSGKPLIFILGAAMRGIAGGERLQHLACWRIDAKRVDEMREAIMASTDDNPIDIADFYVWAEKAKIEWCSVLEDRPEIVTRRDAESASAWWAGRHVVIFGCGAIGSAVAMLLARAGVGKLQLYDKDSVKPGILVRQVFDRYQIGANKAEATAENVRFANPAVEALRSGADVVRILEIPERRADVLTADVIINATASTMVATALERQFRTWPKTHPPIISMALGHKADQALMTMAVQAAPGITLDIDRRSKIALSNLAQGRHVLDEFWPVSPDRTRLFQPEPGCSSPTFRGSAADVMALTAQMTNVASRWLANPLSAVSRARSFDQTGRRTGAVREFEFEWPNDVTLTDGRNGYQIRVSQAALSGMRAWMRRSERVNGRRVETGGILFGHTDEFLKIIWIDEISGPPPDSIQSATAFVCGTAGVSEMNAEKTKRTRKSVAFVGMWHTHPGGMPLPSDTDYGAMAKLLSGDEFQAKRFLMVIIGADSSRPIISGTVFERADYQ
ncbi:JAB domain-containing protein [Tardiphaga sp. OK246]|jgi:proteasome lid subunit RPN8/RPN11|uniref:ThiF family adenylyltransferase n=1 Tax=Tardiphaga sp. OK246 TaxID=1855307 RepID=UPI000B724965|nr:ThiF family adenylyltransferase [Tardiphaga sp. OK246]SNT53067.1 JAB domain-containing protein [Tardiphaga sp. OK246]